MRNATIKPPSSPSPVYGAAAVLADLEQGEEPLSSQMVTRESVFHRDGNPPSLGKIHRLHLTGLNGVRLEGARIAGAKVTTRRAIMRFIRRLSGAEPSTPATNPQVGGAAKAEELLNRAGL
jgi:hypothetical protein